MSNEGDPRLRHISNTLLNFSFTFKILKLHEISWNFSHSNPQRGQGRPKHKTQQMQRIRRTLLPFLINYDLFKLMLLIWSSVEYYSPFDLRFCFYIEKIRFLDENFSWETHIEKNLFVCFSFLFCFVLIVCLGRKTQRLKAKKKNISARHNNRCRNRPNVSNTQCWMVGKQNSSARGLLSSV